MNSEKLPVFTINAPGATTPSGRPSMASTRSSAAASVHGPRSTWSEGAVGPTASDEIVATYLGTRPVRLFKHQRRRHHGDAALSTVAHVPETEVVYPNTLHEVEQWLREVVGRAQQPTADHSSTICLLFMDEDKCKREYHGFSLDRLYGHLQITDWRPSHFQTTFCRFAVPLGVEMEHGGGHSKSSKHHSWDWRFAISHPFDWDMLWAYFPASRTSVGIVRTWIEGYTADFMDLESMAKSFSGPSLGHPMLLGLFALDILTRDTMLAVRQKGEQLWQAQKVTGYNHFPHQLNKRLVMSDEDDRLAADISAQTAVVMGAAINLTAWIHAATQLADFATFIRGEGARFTGGPFSPNDPRDARLATYIEQHAMKQVGDLNGAHYDTSAWLDTSRFLLQGVLNLAAQRDSAVNIQIARDSQKIAEDSKRDSTSMMSLAIVTMLFLPGTYTATLFAMPLFVDVSTNSGSYTMWLYWVLTVMSTLIVFTTWYLYTRRKFKQMNDWAKKNV